METADKSSPVSSARPATAALRTARLRLLLLGAALVSIPASAAAQAVDTHGSGVLTMCRNWLVSRSCRIYHHIVLPARITVGDTLRLRFGSNPKDYNFNVMRIVRDGEQCTIFDNISEPSNQIEIDQCREAAGSP